MEWATPFFAATTAAATVFWLLQTLAVRGERERARLAATRAEALERERNAGRFNLEAIISGMQEGLLVADRNHVVRLVNKAFQDMFGIPSNPEGRTVLETVRDAAIEGLVREVLATGQPRSAKLEVMRAGRKPVHLAANALPAGGTGGVVVVLHDITRMREVETMQRDFVANVSHELRTPLSIFQGYLETLVDNPDMPREDVDAILLVLQRHSRRLNALVEDLLTLARLEARKAELDLVPLDVGQLLAGVVRDFSIAARARGVALSFGCSPERCIVPLDPLRFEQVCGNLLDNALKYTLPGGTVTVEAGIHGGGLFEMVVRDTGPGIPAEALPRIFERFYRVDKARGRDEGGTGLGLSIVKHIVALHGGEVSAESALGKGTAIRVRIPVARGA